MIDLRNYNPQELRRVEHFLISWKMSRSEMKRPSANDLKKLIVMCQQDLEEMQGNYPDEMDTFEASRYCGINHNTLRRHTKAFGIPFEKKMHHKNISNVYKRKDLDKHILRRSKW